jgi:tetratricopeptide (TPR) repeat protein
VGPSVQTEQWADRPFIGRAAEYGALCDAWDSSLQLDTRHILLTGESGIGKSTLALRFGTAAALEGAAVARVQCFELEQRIPFGTIGALVTSLLDRPGVVATAPESLAEIARVVPRVRERFPHLPAPRTTEGESARLHFAEGVFALFDATMDEQPLILIVDDYPRSDEASLAVLHMLLRRTGCEQLMVVLSGRPAEPGEPAQAARIRKGVEYLPLRHLELGPLSEAECEEVLSAVLGRAARKPAAPERRALLRASSGNPMALELLAQDWAAHGDAALAVSLPAMTAEVPASALEAAGYDRLVERILSEIPPRTRVALYLAAILGPRLNDLDSFRIVDLTSTQTMAALADLVSYRLLRDVGGQLEFVNELVRGRLYVRIPSAIRFRLHNAVADRLLAEVAAGQTLPGLEVAWHCIRARRPEEGTPFLMRGAREAITHGAPDEAARALASAVRQLKGRVRDEALLLLAETYQEMAEWKGALECIEEMSRGHRQDEYLREMAKVLEIESRRQLGYFSTDHLPEVLDTLLGIVRNSAVPTAQIQAAVFAASVAASLRDYDLIVKARRAIQEARIEVLVDAPRYKVFLASAMLNFHARQNQNGLPEASAAAQLLREANATDSTYAQIQTGLGAMAWSVGAFSDALECFETAYHVAVRLDNWPVANRAARNLAYCMYHLGRQRELERWCSIAQKTCEHFPADTWAGIHHASLTAMASIAGNRVHDAEEALRCLRNKIRVADLPWIRQTGFLYEADVTCLMGHAAQSLAAVREARGVATLPLSIAFIGMFVRWSTRLFICEERAQEALLLAHECYDQITRIDPIDRAEVLCALLEIEMHTPVQIPDLKRQALVALAELPLATIQHFKALGIVLPA